MGSLSPNGRERFECPGGPIWSGPRGNACRLTLSATTGYPSILIRVTNKRVSPARTRNEYLRGGFAPRWVISSEQPWDSKDPRRSQVPDRGLVPVSCGQATGRLYGRGVHRQHGDPPAKVLESLFALPPNGPPGMRRDGPQLTCSPQWSPPPRRRAIWRAPFHQDGRATARAGSACRAPSRAVPLPRRGPDRPPVSDLFRGGPMTHAPHTSSSGPRSWRRRWSSLEKLSWGRISFRRAA